MTEVIETDVLIVGAGPVGLSFANELGYHDIDYVLVDEGEGKIFFPAGENIFSRTMEHLRRWGIAERVRFGDAISPDYPRNMGFCTTVDGWPLALFPGVSNAQAPVKDPYSPEGGLFYPKKGFDSALRQAAEENGGDLRYGHRLISFEQDSEYVTSTVERLKTGETFRIRSRYLGACDGARSTVRKQLGINYIGNFGEGFNFAVYFRCPGLGDKLKSLFGQDMAQVHTVCHDNRAYLTAVDGRDEWRFSMYTEEKRDFDPKEVVAAAIGQGLAFEVMQAQPWTGHRVVAERYRDNRAFLLGDSNHLRWPKGGFGANTGIGDAVDLGWKLAARLQGWGGEALLDSYEIERRPIATRNTNEAANNRVFDGMIVPEPHLEDDDKKGEEARQRMRDLLFALRYREFTTAGIQLGHRYRQSPICIPDHSLEPPDDHMLYRPSTYPGGRAPHAWMHAGRSTLDLFGKGYVLLAFGKTAGTDAFLAEAERMGIPAEMHLIEEEQIGVLYEKPLVLVRPDGHVCWRGDQLPQSSTQLWSTVAGRQSADGP
ncbi:FAD-dependent monooxygenase [Rhizobium sp. PAMB 3182]